MATKKKLPNVETVRSTRGEVIFHFDPTKVPSKKTKLSHRVEFAGLYLERYFTGQPASKSVMNLCIKWVQEGARALKDGYGL